MPSALRRAPPPRLAFQPVVAKTSLEFIRGIEEKSVPDVRLTRSVDGTNGTAIFRFTTPSILSESDELGDITGMAGLDMGFAEMCDQVFT